MTAIEVSLEVAAGSIAVGSADIDRSRGTTTTRFDYDRGYLATQGWDLSPDLPVIDGAVVVEGLPGAIADSSPDAWGRNLITRRRAREWAGHGTPALSEVDFLLGVSDETRQGALRFSTGGPFLAADGAVPPVIELGRLLAAASAVASGTDADAAVSELLDAGSGSLGGARPKASVVDGGGLSIAKFPHPDDRWDVMRWEAVALDLAEACGLRVPDRRIELVGTVAVLLVRRFDRDGGARVPYLSAQSLVRAETGSGDYLEIVEAMADHGSDVAIDLAELWRRIAFSIVLNNTDDHLRNHGFLRARGGWTLSPLFDVNPTPDPSARRATSIRGETSSERSRAALFGSIDDFWLSEADAQRHWREIVDAVSGWRSVAERHGLPAEEVARFAVVLDRWATDA